MNTLEGPRDRERIRTVVLPEYDDLCALIAGEHKARIVQRAVEGEVSHDVAATYLQSHANATVYLDLAAAAELARIRLSWPS